jgi:poly-gamma-glutamate capsule biosynthesis protein CapA/YwtB (metallophosphatase superfamily)
VAPGQEARLSGTFALACLGDVMPAGLPDAGWDEAAARAWSPVADADAVLVNLETPVTMSAELFHDKRYCFRTPPDALRMFDSRFIIGLANNHVFDYGERGLLDTLDALKARGAAFAGAGRNLQEAGPIVVERAGVRLGIVCAADPRYHPATPTSAGTFPAVPELLQESLRGLRPRADCLVVSIHTGQEFLPVPSQRQVRLADLCLAEGASVVSFHHAHCVSGVRRDARGLVLFGTGNYLFPRGDTPAAYSAFQESAAWCATVDRSGGAVRGVDVRPVVLSSEGWPVEATASRAAAIRRRIERYSRKIAEGRLERWRLMEMARPVYLWMNAVNYADIAKRHGVRASVAAVLEGVRANITTKKVGR